VERLALAGFDHFSRERSTEHHYWLKGRNFGAPVEHDGEAEAAIFNQWLNAGRVHRLGIDT
jgi:hypothetical protein